MTGGDDGFLLTANDTWEYAPVHAAAFVPFGTGCPGSGGTPTLAAEQGSLPWLGATFVVRLTNVGTNPLVHLPLVFLGDSNTQWGSLSLPLDLTFFGMPGCMLYTNVVATFVLTNSSGSATWSVPIPNAPALLGAALYTQGGATSPGTNPAGVITSNACALRIGGR